MRRIWLYGHIWPKIEVFVDFGGLGILPYFSYIYPIGPVWGLLLGSFYMVGIARSPVMLSPARSHI